MTSPAEGDAVAGFDSVFCAEPAFGSPREIAICRDRMTSQAAGVMIKLSVPHDADRPVVFYLVKVDNARFSRTVVPGDQLRLEITHKRTMRNMSLFHGQAFVGEDLAAEAEMLCAEVPNG